MNDSIKAKLSTLHERMNRSDVLRRLKKAEAWSRAISNLDVELSCVLKGNDPIRVWVGELTFEQQSAFLTMVRESVSDTLRVEISMYGWLEIDTKNEL